MTQPIPYRQLIKELRLQIEALEKQVAGLEAAAEAQEGMTETSKPKRKPRAITPETKQLMAYVQDVFREVGTPSMKLIELIRAVILKYPEDQREADEKMRDRIHNLKKSNFLTSEDAPYGHVRLTKPVRAKKSAEDSENTP